MFVSKCQICVSNSKRVTINSNYGTVLPRLQQVRFSSQLSTFFKNFFNLLFTQSRLRTHLSKIKNASLFGVFLLPHLSALEKRFFVPQNQVLIIFLFRNQTNALCKKTSTLRPLILFEYCTLLQNHNKYSQKK